MKKCKTCGSDDRMVSASGKCSDLFSAVLLKHGNLVDEGYVPSDLGLGADEDYLELVYCLNCGQMEGNWPRPTTRLEKGFGKRRG